jgi:hypothetical protein
MNVTAKVAVSTKSVADVPGQWDPKTERYDATVRNATVVMYADYANGANKEWASSTPSLQLTMVLNGDVEQFFEPGGKYTLTFVRDDV